MNNPARFRPVAPQFSTSEAPLVPIAKKEGTKDTSVPLTISLPTTTIKRARLLASGKGTSLSKLIGALLDTAIRQELNAVLAEVAGEHRGAK